MSLAEVSLDPIPEIETIDKSQWKPEEYGLVYHFVNFARMANSVQTEPGELQGWFTEAWHRQYSYAPFNGRVMENYHSLAFFYGYEAPWNTYRQDPRVLSRLELTLEYTFKIMGDNGAIPEYATAELDTPMLAPSSFGMEYMTNALEIAGDLLPDTLKARLIEHARKAAVYVLTSEESWGHARAFTNQFLGAMAGGAQLARLTGDDELQGMVQKASEALLDVGNFMSPMGFLYENNGPETFSYFFVSLHRLIRLYHEWKDPRVLEVLRRHCSWMCRWMLVEPDGGVLLSCSHQTRTAADYRLEKRSSQGLGALLRTLDQTVPPQNGIEQLMPDGMDERRFLKMFLSPDGNAERHRGDGALHLASEQRRWEEVSAKEEVEMCRQRLLSEAYKPVSTLTRFPICALPQSDINAARDDLPCLDATPRSETLEDDRGNQYVFVRHPNYHIGLAFASRRTTANHGPAFVWVQGAGTAILSENGTRPCWETHSGDERTGKAPKRATVREGRGGTEVLLHYDGFEKTYVIRPEGIDVLISRNRGGRALTERIPLLLREEDVIHVDYGRCLASGMGTRVLGLVTKTLAIEREGQRILSFDMSAPVQVTLSPTYDDDGYIRTMMMFQPAATYFGKKGYQVTIGT